MYNSYQIAGNVLRESLRKKDFYVFLIFLLVLTIYLANMSFFDVGGISRYLKEISLEMSYLFSLIIVITFSAKLLPVELESKTIYPLLAKPIKRRDVIIGKFLGAGFVAGVCFSIFYFLIGIIAALKGEGFALDLFFQGYALWLAMLLLAAAMVVFFSTFLTISANIALSFCLYFLMSWFGAHLREMAFMSRGASGWGLAIFYYLLPHFEFYDLRVRLVQMWDKLPLYIVIFVMAYTVIYISIFLWLAIFCFKKKGL